MTKQEQLLHWLNDAHAMEEESIRILQDHVDDAESFPDPDAKSMIQEHLGQTKTQAERLAARIEQLGGHTSKVKEVAGAVMGKLAGLRSETHDDQIVKNSLLEYAIEHYEMACYSSLKAAAEALEDIDTVTLVEQIFQEEQRMAEFLAMSLAAQTKEYLSTLEAVE